MRLFYIIRLWASLLICRQARERPLTTCYVNIALRCFFSGANQVRWWWSRCNRDKSPYLMSFLPCGWIGSLIFLRNEKKQCANLCVDCKKCDRKKQQQGGCAEAGIKTVQAPTLCVDKCCGKSGGAGLYFRLGKEACEAARN